MDVIIREYDSADAEAVADLMREALPYMVTTARTVQAQVSEAPAAQRYRVLVAEQPTDGGPGGGRIVGSVRMGLYAGEGRPADGFANLTVGSADRRRGTGRALLALAESYLTGLGATTVYSWATDEPASHAFAESHGYVRGRSGSFLRLDLAMDGPLPDRPQPGPGVVLLPASHWADDPRPLYEVDRETIEDEPNDTAATAPGYADWRAMTWDRPGFDHELSVAAVVDGTVAAFVCAETDGRTRYWSGGTGTRRAFRGRGLAKAAKAESLHRARAAGYTDAFTNNDDTNAPMLAVNRWFGYQPCGNEWRYARDLTDRA
ncbi:GNAT family N-acetyltransferase [Streptomyces sp. NPDC051976]|uniref:GNAT family N-acetyltransferase n=1 Tax=Streptomyces sp. NPDC051976 TaxID=3154947 RepID=UPI0034330A1D